MIEKIINFLNSTRMENAKIFNQYSWIGKVLDSCENETQIFNTQRLFENFIKNWGNQITKNSKQILVNEFERDVKKKRTKVSKKFDFYTEKF